MTKKYLRLGCTVCKRQIDKLVDLTHYTPDHCSITLGCEGRLQPLEYRSSGGIAVAPEIGVTDWRPRGSSANGTVQITEDRLVLLETGPHKQLTIAVPTDGLKFVLPLTVKTDAPKNYRQYIFRKEGSFTTISGVESGLEKKALRFTAYGANPDQVEVFVNGVKREKGTNPADYQIYDGTDASGAPPNTILFNTILDSQSNTQVDVIVSKEVEATVINLTFTRHSQNESRQGAYENISFVDRMVNGTWKRYYLYSLDLDSAGIPLNTIAFPKTMDAFFMLAVKPFTQLDRYTDLALYLDGLGSEDFIKYYAEDKVPTARVPLSSLSNFFPPLRITKFVVEKTIKTAIDGVEEQVVVDGKVITGPDA